MLPLKSIFVAKILLPHPLQIHVLVVSTGFERGLNCIKRYFVEDLSTCTSLSGLWLIKCKRYINPMVSPGAGVGER